MKPRCLVPRSVVLIAAALSALAPASAGARAEPAAPFVPVTDAKPAPSRHGAGRAAR